MYRDDIWRFMTDAGVPFTNHLAEQALRMSKVRQKISGCFRTPAGAQTFFTIRSYLDTIRKQGASLLDCLVATLNGQPIQPRLGRGAEWLSISAALPAAGPARPG